MHRLVYSSLLCTGINIPALLVMGFVICYPVKDGHHFFAGCFPVQPAGIFTVGGMAHLFIGIKIVEEIFYIVGIILFFLLAAETIKTDEKRVLSCIYLFSLSFSPGLLPRTRCLFLCCQLKRGPRRFCRLSGSRCVYLRHIGEFGIKIRVTWFFNF